MSAEIWYVLAAVLILVGLGSAVHGFLVTAVGAGMVLYFKPPAS